MKHEREPKLEGSKKRKIMNSKIQNSRSDSFKTSSSRARLESPLNINYFEKLNKRTKIQNTSSYLMVLLSAFVFAACNEGPTTRAIPNTRDALPSGDAVTDPETAERFRQQAARADAALADEFRSPEELARARAIDAQIEIDRAGVTNAAADIARRGKKDDLDHLVALKEADAKAKNLLEEEATGKLEAYAKIAESSGSAVKDITTGLGALEKGKGDRELAEARADSTNAQTADFRSTSEDRHQFARDDNARKNLKAQGDNSRDNAKAEADINYRNAQAEELRNNRFEVATRTEADRVVRAEAVLDGQIVTEQANLRSVERSLGRLEEILENFPAEGTDNLTADQYDALGEKVKEALQQSGINKPNPGEVVPKEALDRARTSRNDVRNQRKSERDALNSKLSTLKKDRADLRGPAHSAAVQDLARRILGEESSPSESSERSATDVSTAGSRVTPQPGIVLCESGEGGNEKKCKIEELVNTLLNLDPAENKEQFIAAYDKLKSAADNLTEASKREGSTNDVMDLFYEGFEFNGDKAKLDLGETARFLHGILNSAANEYKSIHDSNSDPVGDATPWDSLKDENFQSLVKDRNLIIAEKALAERMDSIGGDFWTIAQNDPGVRELFNDWSSRKTERGSRNPIPLTCGEKSGALECDTGKE